MSDYHLHTFANGIRLVYSPNLKSQISYCGIILDVGSRDEQAHQAGIAHFWEHMAFKGTKKRKNYHILHRIESVGGEINAYTSKEKICFYSTQLSDYLERAIELLTDITFFSVFPEKEIEKERQVILEEMAMYEDTPSDAIADDFDSLLFAGHSLGFNILGTRETVSKFQQSDFHAFIAQNVSTEKVVLSVISPWSFKKVVRVAEKYLKDIPHQPTTRKRQPFTHKVARSLAFSKENLQAHCVIGGLSCSLFDENRFSFFLLHNLLGGSGMSSRLNMSIREKYGYVYDIQANQTFFSDIGYFTISFATEAKNLLKCIHLVEKELKLLREKKLGSVQLHTAKQQLKGQLAIAEESKLSLMLGMGKSILDRGDVESLETIFTKIDAITSSQLLDMANQYYHPDYLSRLVYIPTLKT